MIKLIAFVDGSSYSRSVCDHAAWVAARVKGSVDLLHVLGRAGENSGPTDFSGSIGLGARTALLEELSELDGQVARLAHKRGRAILEDARDIIQGAGVDDVTTMLRNEGIIETVQGFEEGTDLVVIGKRGEGTETDEEHLGSNFERVVRASHKPIMVAARTFKPIKRFLIAFDGGASALKAVNYLAQNNMFNDLECRILNVTKPTQEVEQQLESAASSLREAGYSVQKEIRDGQPESVICEKISEENIDLLIMGAYGHSRIRNLIIGSTTTQMIRSCKIPVLLFR